MRTSAEILGAASLALTRTLALDAVLESLLDSLVGWRLPWAIPDHRQSRVAAEPDHHRP